MTSIGSAPSRTTSRNGFYPSYSPNPQQSSSRPTMDRMPSTMSDISATSSTPIATNSALNKVGSASSSLYQNCRNVLDKLERVPGFSEQFQRDGSLGESTVNGGPDGMGGVAGDPVSRSLHVLRLGSSLCYLFNALGLDHTLEVNPTATMNNLKACQRGTAHFIMACKQHLRWSDQDLFAIHELYGQDTNGVVKVINTVTKILDKLESMGKLMAPLESPVEATQPSGPSDERSMVVREILDSERKYVQDLEVLQDYQRQVLANDILTQDQIHNLFLNLNSLADFQRRFLIGVEANASLAPSQQHFGSLFMTMEDHFSVYEPYCANLTAAQELAISENASLAKLSHVLDPVSELLPLLIKPVQRICKYPLLLNTLVKNTPKSNPCYGELLEGQASIERVTARVNETTRKEDNRQSVLDLTRRVEDWKGHDIGSFGELLLRETFFVIKSESEREYNVYLFERIILCCKEMGSSGKKSSKSNSILKRPPSRRPASLQLKGRIFVNNVTDAQPVTRNGQYLLEVRWRGDVGEEAFTIKCRTEELQKQWQKTISKAVEDSPHHRRRAHHLSNGRRTPGVNSPLSQFPGTPLSEGGPSSASIFSQQSDFSTTAMYHSNHAQPSYPPHSNGFDDEGDEPYSESGRSTPSGMSQMRRTGPSTRSLPPGERERDDRGDGRRPRAQTEDTSSAVINQWRNQTPTGQPSVPSLPRNASHASNGSESHSLRSSASSRQLRSKQSTEWGQISQQQQYGNGQHMSYRQQPDDDSRQPNGNSVPRQSSHTNVASVYPAHPLMRNRSASSPNIYQGSPQPDGSDQWGGGGYVDHGGYVPNVPPLSMSHKASGATNSAGTLASASSASTNKKRFSASSNGTDRSSGTSSQSAGAPYSNATSPATQPPSAGLPALPNDARSYQAQNQGPPGGSPAAVRVKVTYGDDTFVVVLLSSASHDELVDKVLKKIRMCGDRSIVDAPSLRLRYQDEDGDRILITSGEDVSMAFELAKSMNANSPLTLLLFASTDSN